MPAAQRVQKKDTLYMIILLPLEGGSPALQRRLHDSHGLILEPMADNVAP